MLVVVVYAADGQCGIIAAACFARYCCPADDVVWCGLEAMMILQYLLEGSVWNWKRMGYRWSLEVCPEWWWEIRYWNLLCLDELSKFNRFAWEWWKCKYLVLYLNMLKYYKMFQCRLYYVMKHLSCDNYHFTFTSCNRRVRNYDSLAYFIDLWIISVQLESSLCQPRNYQSIVIKWTLTRFH